LKPVGTIVTVALSEPFFISISGTPEANVTLTSAPILSCRVFSCEINEKLKELRKELQLKAAKLSKYSVDDILKQGYTITRKNGKIAGRFAEIRKIAALF